METGLGICPGSVKVQMEQAATLTSTTTGPENSARIIPIPTSRPSCETLHIVTYVCKKPGHKANAETPVMYALQATETLVKVQGMIKHHISSLGVLAALNDQHLVLGGAKDKLPHRSSFAKFVWCQLLEARHDPGSCSHCYQLDLNSTNPSHSGQVIGHEQMVGFVIKAPLADDEGGTRVLALLNHVSKVLLLCRPQALKLLYSVNVYLSPAGHLSVTGVARGLSLASSPPQGTFAWVMTDA